MLAEIIGHVVAPAGEGGSTDTAPPTEAFACGPAECSNLAQQLFSLILELLGEALVWLSLGWHGWTLHKPGTH